MQIIQWYGAYQVVPRGMNTPAELLPRFNEYFVMLSTCFATKWTARGQKWVNAVHGVT